MSVGSSRVATTGQAITWVGWQRICGLAGVIASFLGIAASVLTTSTSPTLNDSPRQIALAHREHLSTFIASDLMLAISAFFLLWFLGGLLSALRQQVRERATLSLIAFAPGLVVVVGLFLDA